MDIKQYFRKIKETESSITELYPVIVSLETSDGGKAGSLCEVPRAVAAKMIVERKATLASVEEREMFFQQQEIAKKAAEKAEMARRLQVAIVADSDFHNATTAKVSSKKQ